MQRPAVAAPTALPDWWPSSGLVPTRICGYVDVSDAARVVDGWECFEQATGRGEHVELVTWTATETGRTVHWWRSSAAEGEPSGHQQHIMWTDEPDAPAIGWTMVDGCPRDGSDVSESCGNGPLGTVIGTVTNADGQPAAGTVSLRQRLPPDGPGVAFLTNADLVTANDGSFQLRVLPGVYDMWGLPDGDRGGSCTSAGTTITVVAGEPVVVDLTCADG